MKRTTYVARAGVIAAVYAVFTLVMVQNPLGYGPVQFRLSEAVTVIAALTPAAIPGLLIGSVVANSFMVAQFGALALLDVVFGSLATALGAIWTWRLRKRPAIALLGPVITNALIVPAYLPIILAATGFYNVNVLGVNVASSWPTMYAFGVLSVAVGQAIVIYALGLPLLLLLKRLKVGDGFDRRV
ncbi:MAG: QueT transporter family protein [Actinomycetota bacterium]|nr:MAG: hypothetical protein FD171_1146 [Actinomycetota bacterium]MDO8949864.1 QueT transporter family protein [Actinomycetota bacterium]MDP3629446.1 QueT transporter family protein [Actinomycetota bacterium]